MHDDTIIETHDDAEYVLSVLEAMVTPGPNGGPNYDAVERAMLAAIPAHLRPDIGISHQFCNGVYMREMFAQAGSLILGHEHSEPCFNIILQGKIRVFVNSELKEISAPQVFVTPANTRKLGYVVEDLRWINVIASDSTNVEDIEKRFIVKSDAYLEWESLNNSR